MDDRAQRLIERFPEAVRPHLEESIGRLSLVRSVSDGLAALQDEVEHLLRAGMPVFLKHLYLKSPILSTAFAAVAGGLVAGAEEADELAVILSVGTVAAPGTATVLVLGFLASAAEAYAATCARAAQLSEQGCPIVAEQVAEDVRLAMFGDLGAGSTARSVVRRAGRAGVRRLARRWAVGAVPIIGVFYAAWDSGRTVRRVLALPFPQATAK